MQRETELLMLFAIIEILYKQKLKEQNRRYAPLFLDATEL